ncbi:phosphatase PAP2 family protein [Microbacterium sp. P04]|uniref:phosphatase PAP2 family protein n=1 Tax=Microbacterium sp. P04 TaxID=3366947 RepID=UPI00374736E6
MTRPTPDDRAPGVEAEVTRDRYVGARDLTRWPKRIEAAVVAVAQWAAARLGPYTTLVITLVLGITAVVLLSVAAVEVYDAVADEDGVAGIDEPLLMAMMSVRSPGLNIAVTAFTDLAGGIVMPIIAVVAILVLGIKRRSWTPLVIIAAAGTGSLLMTIAGKEIIQRQRPPLADAVPPYEFSPSFPSGHTLNAVAVIGAITYLLVLRRTSRAARIALIAGASVFAFLVGMSRVYLGHHWFTDVLVGWILGALWLGLVILAHRLYLTMRAIRQSTHPAVSPGAN